MVSNLVIVSRLILASILGGLIGLERESSNRPAGFRTHILVVIGSTLIMMVSVDSYKFGADPSRIAAQVVSVIGFLGAGTILRRDSGVVTGNNIEGLTTAASLWVCAGIGLAVGNGYYLGAITTTAIVLFFLKNARSFERILLKRRFKVFQVVCKARPGLIGEVGTVFGEYDISIKDISISSVEMEENIKEEIHFTIKSPNNVDLNNLLDDIYKIEGIYKVILDDDEL